MKRLLLFFLILFLFPGIMYCQIKNEKIIILSFFNSGSIEYDRFCESIPTYLYTLLESISGYSVIPPSELKMHMQKKGYRKTSLEEEKTIVALALDYEAKYIIEGFFKVQEKHIFISFTIRKHETGNAIIVEKDITYVKMEDTDTVTLDNALEPVISFFSALEIKSALLTVKTEKICQLYVDNVLLCQTPQHVRLSEGEHRIQIFYQDKTDSILLFDKTIAFSADKNEEIDIPVFLDMNVTAGRECTVFINGVFRGMTPFTTTVYAGTEYHIRVVYKDEHDNDVEVADFSLPDSYYTDIDLDYPETGTIVVKGATPFLARLNNGEVYALPYNFSLLGPGEYNLEVFIRDNTWKRDWIFYDEIHILKPFADIALDKNDLQFNKALWKCFLPSVSQFHNKQKTKGTIVAGLFCATLLTSGISYVIGNIAYNDYKRILAARKPTGIESGYTTGDLAEKQRVIDAATITFNVAFFSAGALSLYSCIDGWITMDHINKLFYPAGEIR